MSTIQSNYCYKHPSRETGLSCVTCGKPICIDCLVQTSVGGKCKGCARGTKNPLSQMRVQHYLIALALGMAAGTVAGLVISEFRFILLGFFLGPTLGYGIGDLIKRAVKGRYGLGLALVSSLGIVGGMLIGSVFAYGGIIPGALGLLMNPTAWILAIFAMPSAWWRLR